MKNRLKYYRVEKADLSMRQLSNLCHVSLQTIWGIENRIKKDRGYNYSTKLLLFNGLKERVPSLKRLIQLFPEEKKKKIS